MIKNLLHLYALLVCFITVIILIITFSLSLNFVTDILIPNYKYSSALRHYKSNESYIEYYEGLEVSKYGNTEGVSKETLSSLKKLSPSQLSEQRVSSLRSYLEYRQTETIASLISTLQWALVALIFFFIHWKIYQRSKACEDNTKK